MVRLIRRARPEVTTLVSYQDKSVHSGTIYKAAGWQPTATKKYTPWSNTTRTRPECQAKADKQRWELIIRPPSDKINEPQRCVQHRAALTTPSCKEQGMADSQPILAQAAPQGSYEDLSGKFFGKLTVKGFAEKRSGKPYWLVECECGNSKVVRGQYLRDGAKSCGCTRGKVTHGFSRRGRVTPEYKAWQAMIQRCVNPDHEAYKNYGARGITVCQLWRNSFDEFFASMGKRPTPKHSLERINNDRGYSPDNCKWATRTEQNRNKRPKSHTRKTT
jgi:hypothetical protein